MLKISHFPVEIWTFLERCHADPNSGSSVCHDEEPFTWNYKQFFATKLKENKYIFDSNFKQKAP